jgi:hypothetical protein
LKASGAALSYPALTGFCRRQGIGQAPVVPAGQYHFEPGVEMQHDTSPHEVEVGGKRYKAQTISLLARGTRNAQLAKTLAGNSAIGEVSRVGRILRNRISHALPLGQHKNRIKAEELVYNR